MGIKLDTITLSPYDVSRLFGLSKRTVVYWCQKGQINTFRLNPKGNWYIPGNAVAVFLVNNPKRVAQLRHMVTTSLSYTNRIRKALLEEIDRLPRLYSLEDIADIFDVTTDAVRYWIKMGYMPIYGREGRILLFDDRCIKKFLHNVPRYRKIYTAYNRRKEQEAIS